jgi:hypothetical protein
VETGHIAIDVADKPTQKGHRKDNSEWGKRMERQMGQIEKRQTAKGGAGKVSVIPFIPCIKLMSDE